MTPLAERLRKALAGRKQIDLAKACGVTAPSVNQWLSGESKRMDAVHLVKACDFLKVRPKWLALGVGPMTDREAETVPLVDLTDLVAWLRANRPDLM